MKWTYIHTYTHQYINTHTHIRKDLQREELNKFISSNCKTFVILYKGFRKFFHHKNDSSTFANLLFHPYQQNINTFCHINQVCCCPGNSHNVRSN